MTGKVIVLLNFAESSLYSVFSSERISYELQRINEASQ